jgi:peptidyl-prolyl cis-trans isomerase SurA
MKRIHVITIFLMMCALCPGDVFSGILLDRVVAVVNNEVITWSELYKMMEYEAANLESLSNEQKMKVMKENEAEFLSKMIDMKLQLQEAKNLGFRISPGDLSEAIENIKKKYSMNDSALRESLKREGLTFEEYEERLSEQMLINQFVNRQIRNRIVVSDAEVQKYLKEKEEEFYCGDTFRLRQIFIKMPKDQNETDRKQVEEKAYLIIQKIQEGAEFSRLAREYCEDASRNTGGDLGYVKKDILAQEFIDVLSEMQVGDVSSPFWTSQGLHIIRLEDKKTVHQDEVVENARKSLLEIKFAENYKSYVKSLRENAHIEIRL